jgi:hypothetical protein
MENADDILQILCQAHIQFVLVGGLVAAQLRAIKERIQSQ